jgi:hypothetical protein
MGLKVNDFPKIQKDICKFSITIKTKIFQSAMEIDEFYEECF